MAAEMAFGGLGLPLYPVPSLYVSPSVTWYFGWTAGQTPQVPMQTLPLCCAILGRGLSLPEPSAVPAEGGHGLLGPGTKGMCGPRGADGVA